MNSIGDFLKRYLNFTPPALVTTRALIKAINERFGVELDERAVEIKGGRVFVRTNTSLKSEIALNKQALLVRAKELGAGFISELS